MRSDVKDGIIRHLGKFPEMSHSPALSRKKVKCKDGISYYALSYELEPGEMVTSWYLVPENRTKLAAIVACHQHNDEYFVGKSEPAGFYSKAANTFAITLAHAGYAVLCPDFLGFEDRRPSEYERVANPFQQGASYERFLFIDYLLKGSSLQAKNISDLSRAVDILSEQNEVDPARIGICGHSLGGQEAIWAMFSDDRIKAGVFSCGTALIKDLQARHINHNYAMYLPSFLERYDMDDVIASIAPRPVELLYGKNDAIFPYDSVKKLSDSVRSEYETLGVPENFCSIMEDCAHDFRLKEQENALSFFSKHL